MDLDNSPAEFDFTELSLTAFLTKPISLGGDWTAIAYLDLRVSEFDINGNALIGTFVDDIQTDLFRVGIPFAIVHSKAGSRWAYGAWVNPAISSDFDHIDSADIFVDGAVAATYQWNENLVVGAGVYVSDMFRDIWAIPGAGFFWTPTEDWFISYYGPRFVARHDINDHNQIGFEVSTGGGTWNIDANNNSLKLNLRSWRTGLYYRHNLVGDIWLEAAAGYTFGNKLELQTRGGLGLFENRLGKAQSAPYASVGVSVARW